MFKKLLNKILPKGQFARGVAVLVGGTASAQLLMILASPILTRLYTPEDFGLLAVYTSILSIFIVVASLRYELAIPLPEKDSEAVHVIVLSLLILICMTIVSTLVIYITKDEISKLVNAPKLSYYLWLVPVGVFFIGAYQIFNYWAIRVKNFGSITKTKLSQSIATLVIQLAGFKYGVISLMLGQNIGQAVGMASLAKPALQVSEFKKWKWCDIRRVAVRFKSFPIFSTWSGLLSTASFQLPPLLFAIFFSASSAGLYVLAQKILAMPMSLIGGAIGNVFLPNATSAYRENTLSLLFESIYEKLVSIIIPITLILAIDAPNLFALVFGENWREAGVLARWMSPWLAIVFISSPLSSLFTVLEKQREGFYFQAILLIARILAIWIGFYSNSILLAVQLFSLFSILCWIGFLIWASKQVGSSLYKLLKPFFQALPMSLVCCSPLFFTSLFSLTSFYWYFALIMTAGFSSLYYFRVFKKGFI